MTAERSLWRGSASVVAARLGMSAGRLVAIILVARLGGVAQLGAFTLLLSLLALFEWLADFGQTDIAIREGGGDKSRSDDAGAALARLKWLAILPLMVALPAAALLIGQGESLLLSAALAAPGIAALALAQPARTRARLALRPWLDVGAESLAFCLFLLLVALVAANGAALPLLGGAYSLFRIAQLLIISRLAPVLGSLSSPPPVSTSNLARSALPLGMAGLLVAAYDNLAPILLSHIAPLQTVGEYSAAARFAFPVVMIAQAINSAFYPVLVQAPGSAEMSRLQQSALEASLVCAAILAAGLFGAAHSLVQLVGVEGSASATLLRILAAVVLARAVTTSMSPLVIIAGRQGSALKLTILSVLLQLGGILLLFPRFGLAGVGAAFLLVELTLGLAPVSLIGLRATGVRLDFVRPAAIAACACAATTALYWTRIDGSVACGVAAAGLTIILLAAAGLLPIARMMAGFRSVRAART